MKNLYPLKFKPVYKEKVWGGNKIKSSLGLDFGPLQNCGEVWVLSGVEDNQTTVENGFLAGNDLNEIVEVFMGDLVGDKIYEKFGNDFPILIKFIDANDWLSIQVHPDDELAGKRHNSLGKTEMWYILDAEKDAELITGFNKKADKESFKNHLENKTLMNILNYEKVKKGDVFYMPSGRVHALGPGILLAEIQQTSDITYRIYDWDRIDKAGMIRELHTDLAVDTIDFKVYDSYCTQYKPQLDKTVKLVESNYFNTSLLHVKNPIRKDYSELDSFVIYLCVEGSFELSCMGKKTMLSMGESVLIPALLESIEILPAPEAKLMEVYMVTN